MAGGVSVVELLSRSPNVIPIHPSSTKSDVYLIHHTYIYIYGGFHGHGGTPSYGWFWLGKIPSFEMDDDLGVPLFQETYI